MANGQLAFALAPTAELAAVKAAVLYRAPAATAEES